MHFSISAKALLACCSLLRPSKENGIITNPTTKAPASLASFATVGAAPDPVPPPRPAQIKTKDLLAKDSLISLVASWAASSPSSGSPPAPNPCVNCLPSCILS